MGEVVHDTSPITDGLTNFGLPVRQGLDKLITEINGRLEAFNLASNAVTTPKILDAAVTTPKLADLNVTTAKIADLNVTAPKLADLNVTTPKLADLSVTTAKIADGAITAPKGSDGVLVPTGTILPFGGATSPTGYLLCDGAAVSRTTFSALFAVIGIAFGGGDGTTTFNLPSLVNVAGLNRSLVGFNATNVRGVSGGAPTHTLTTAEMPAHTHVYQHTGSTGATPGSGTAGHPSGFSADTSSTGGGAAHNNMPPFVAVNFIIKT